jgi:hypothetical protein
MRNLHLEAAIWYLFTSTEFFESAAHECDRTAEWFGAIAVSRRVANIGRNNQIFETFKRLERDFRRGADLARLGDFQLIWSTARCVRGDVRGMMEQPLHSWLNEVQYEEFEAKISSVMNYAGRIDSALNNAMIGAESFLNPNLNYPERSNDDDGYPGDDIVDWYKDWVGHSKTPLACLVPDPLPEYVIDRSITCQTGDEVPWTGVWYPSTGLERHSLTFAIQGLRMQPVYRVVKTSEELRTDSYMFPPPETLAVATTWHPVIPFTPQVDANKELWAKAGQPCPKAGVWQPTDPGAAQRIYKEGEPMADLGSPYGISVWRWVAER